MSRKKFCMTNTNTKSSETVVNKDVYLQDWLMPVFSYSEENIYAIEYLIGMYCNMYVQTTGCTNQSHQCTPRSAHWCHTCTYENQEAAQEFSTCTSFSCFGTRFWLIHTYQNTAFYFLTSYSHQILGFST